MVYVTCRCKKQTYEAWLIEGRLWCMSCAYKQQTQGTKLDFTRNFYDSNQSKPDSGRHLRVEYSVNLLLGMGPSADERVQAGAGTVHSPAHAGDTVRPDGTDEKASGPIDKKEVNVV